MTVKQLADRLNGYKFTFEDRGVTYNLSTIYSAECKAAASVLLYQEKKIEELQQELLSLRVRSAFVLGVFDGLSLDVAPALRYWKRRKAKRNNGQ